MKKLLPIVVALLVLALAGITIYWTSLPEQNSIDVRNIESEQGEISISITPEKIIQGEPVLIQVNGTLTVNSLNFDGKELPVFMHEGKSSALVGIDLRARSGGYRIEVELEDGSVIEDKILIRERVIAKAPLGIPEELGGDTPEAEKELINTLVQEGAIISAVISQKEKLWDGAFRLPINEPVIITDVYGYTRLTGGSSISHKGTDFRAAVGTPVYAINSGRIAYTDYLRNYGNTVIVDHGFGLLSIYMHLSEVDMKLGDMVKKGELIAKSGQTGYVLGPHLHLTIRINNISIDPMKFMELLGE